LKFQILSPHPYHDSSDQLPPPNIERTSDDLPVRYAGEFGFSLLACLLLEMTLLLLSAGRFDGPPTFRGVLPLILAMTAILAIALAARIFLGLRGVFTGALTATVIILLFAAVLFLLLTRFVQTPAVSLILHFMRVDLAKVLLIFYGFMN